MHRKSHLPFTEATRFSSKSASSSCACEVATVASIMRMKERIVESIAHILGKRFLSNKGGQHTSLRDVRARVRGAVCKTARVY